CCQNHPSVSIPTVACGLGYSTFRRKIPRVHLVPLNVGSNDKIRKACYRSNYSKYTYKLYKQIYEIFAPRTRSIPAYWHMCFRIKTTRTTPENKFHIDYNKRSENNLKCEKRSKCRTKQIVNLFHNNFIVLLLLNNCQPLSF